MEKRSYLAAKNLLSKEFWDKMWADAEPCDIEGRVYRKLEIADLKWHYGRDVLIKRGYSPKEIDSVEPIEPGWIRNARAWNTLAHKFVGTV